MLKGQIDSLLRSKKQLAVLVRHAHRPPIPQGEIGNDVSITDEGKDASKVLGSQFINFSLPKIESSPVRRCIETMRHFCLGAKQKPEMTTSCWLGEPGPFILDERKAGRAFERYGSLPVLKALVQRKPMLGMKDLSVGAREFLNYAQESGAQLRVMFTHDAIIAPLCCYFWSSSSIETYFPDFLEPLFIAWDDTSVISMYRGQTAILKR